MRSDHGYTEVFCAILAHKNSFIMRKKREHISTVVILHFLIKHLNICFINGLQIIVHYKL